MRHCWPDEGHLCCNMCDIKQCELFTSNLGVARTIEGLIAIRCVCVCVGGGGGVGGAGGRDLISQENI